MGKKHGLVVGSFGKSQAITRFTMRVPSPVFQEHSLFPLGTATGKVPTVQQRDCPKKESTKTHKTQSISVFPGHAA